MSSSEDFFNLDNQLCFHLYATSRQVIKRYKPFLDKLGITYTQYIVLMALWDSPTLSMKTLGEKLYLDSGTLTPLLKKLESIQLIKRHRSSNDERHISVELTPQGLALKQEALIIPNEMLCQLNVDKTEAKELLLSLKTLLHNI